MNIEVHEDIIVLLIQAVAVSQYRQYGDITVNLCQWLNSKKITFMRALFDNWFDKYFDRRFFECPIKKGYYPNAVKSRPRTLNVENIMPKFISLKEDLNITVTFKAKTYKNKNKFHVLFKSCEVYRFD